MCGRYYVDNEMVGELEKLIGQMDKAQREESLRATAKIPAGDIYPGRAAPVLLGKNESVCCGWQRWGFPGFREKRLIFNARCESVLEKPLFRGSMKHGRVVIPAMKFYEWNLSKEKSTFRRQNSSLLFMAGLSRRYEDGTHFTVLTTAANASMKPVHDRMPLILERDEITEWMFDDAKAERILHKIPCLLERSSDYEQMRLF